MLLYSFGFAFLLAVIFALLFSNLFNNSGPWGSFWVFLLILFFGIWGASLWFSPVGPLWYGVPWIDMLLIGLFLALLLGAAGEANSRYRDYPKDKEVDIVAESKKETGAIALFGIFFWLFMAVLLAIVLIGVIKLL
ncbi:MAG: hypothetical protein KDD06_02720 [Phaeodactylibacter sp.]|nr:hypothetical protein [Phaeodactylibacter sp.]MCB9265246.1 hypothetical protein [Lewinellaceae bacterium]MCB9290181.1 hypothetical protein [Lewinellaceae bacterium]